MGLGTSIKNFFEIRSLRRDYRRTSKKLAAIGPDDARIQERVALMHEAEAYRVRIEHIRTGRINRKLIDLGLELPDAHRYVAGNIKLDNKNVYNSYLPKHEQRKAARRIRAEQLEKWGLWMKILEPLIKLVIPLLAVASGLIAALVGLISLLRSK